MLAESCWSPACIHHSTSLHFPLSSLRLICLLEFLTAQVFKKPTIFHRTFPKRSPILCFPSYQTLFIIFSFAPKLFFCNTTCLFISSAAPLFFSPPLPWLVCFCLPFICPCCPSRKSLAVSCLHWSVSLGS